MENDVAFECVEKKKPYTSVAAAAGPKWVGSLMFRSPLL